MGQPLTNNAAADSPAQHDMGMGMTEAVGQLLTNSAGPYYTIALTAADHPKKCDQCGKKMSFPSSFPECTQPSGGMPRKWGPTCKRCVGQGFTIVTKKELSKSKADSIPGRRHPRYLVSEQQLRVSGLHPHDFGQGAAPAPALATKQFRDRAGASQLYRQMFIDRFNMRGSAPQLGGQCFLPVITSAAGSVKATSSDFATSSRTCPSPPCKATPGALCPLSRARNVRRRRCNRQLLSRRRRDAGGLVYHQGPPPLDSLRWLARRSVRAAK